MSRVHLRTFTRLTCFLHLPSLSVLHQTHWIHITCCRSGSRIWFTGVTRIFARERPKKRRIEVRKIFPGRARNIFLYLGGDRSTRSETPWIRPWAALLPSDDQPLKSLGCDDEVTSSTRHAKVTRPPRCSFK